MLWTVGYVVKQLATCLCVAVFLSITAVVGTAAPAGACQCVGWSDAEAFAHADAVFVGELIIPGPSLWTFKVSDVYKGKVTRTQEVVSERYGASCGLETPQSGEYLVFGNTARTLPSGPAPTRWQLFADLCGGTRPLSDGVLEPGLAKPHPPSAVKSKPKTTSRRQEIVLLTQADGANGEEALGSGVLRYDAARKCVYLENGDGRLLPQWPEGYSALSNPMRVYDARNRLVAKEGDFVRFSGGYYDPAILKRSAERCGVNASDGLFVMGYPA